MAESRTVLVWRAHGATVARRELGVDRAAPAAGQGSTDLIHARSTMTDEEWIATAGGTTDFFTSRYEQATGINLRPR